jgi:hypothetical protein
MHWLAALAVRAPCRPACYSGQDTCRGGFAVQWVEMDCVLQGCCGVLGAARHFGRILYIQAGGLDAVMRCEVEAQPIVGGCTSMTVSQGIWLASAELVLTSHVVSASAAARDWCLEALPSLAVFTAWQQAALTVN